jgi:hypothetical protein
MKTFAFVFLALLNAQLAFANTIVLTSVEGVKIQIDYKPTTTQTYGCFRCNFLTTASPLIINIDASQFSLSDKVRVVLKNYSHFDMSPELKFLDTFELELSAVDGKLVSQPVEFLIGSEGYGGNGYFSQELTVEVNGVLLKNSENKNTKFDLALN